MDFFEHQEVARRNTGRLVILFALAVASIILLVHLAAVACFAGLLGYRAVRGEAVYGRAAPAPEFSDLLLDPRIMLAAIGGTLIVVSAGTLYRVVELRSGGAAVAELLGGRILNPSTREANERRLLNVVEEMAIASGIAVPPVYVLEEEKNINAFAAGYSSHDAVIGVTRGTVELLDRDELQGVIAHEFSHILNGDMRLSIRLIGLLNGILIIGLAGAMITRSLLYAGHGSRSDRRGGVLPLIAFGIALTVIGYAGTFFGRLIKAAVSRQREFLADASAVQFTRQPSGLAGALKKIGGLQGRAQLVTPRAEEASHMFFGQAIGFSVITMFNTHPPLEERIRRVDPSWDGKFPSLATGDRKRRPDPERRRGAELAGSHPLAREVPHAASVSGFLDSVGQPSAEHVVHAGQLLAALPETLRRESSDSYGARAIVYALLLDPRNHVRERQWHTLSTAAEPDSMAMLHGVDRSVHAIDPSQRLPLLDLCLPSLRELSPAQYERFRQIVLDLIQADQSVDPFEWSLRRIVLDHLDRHFGKRPPTRVHHYSLARLGPAISRLLSHFAYIGHDSITEAERAFAAGAQHLAGEVEVSLVPLEQMRGAADLDEAVESLIRLTPRLKRIIIAACIACVAADREVRVREVELLRALADTLECPLPPLLPGQHLRG